MSFASGNLTGKRRRITGLLEQGTRSLQLVTDSGDRWSLDCEEFDFDLIGQKVTAEGVLVGLDRLKIYWMGDSSA